MTTSASPPVVELSPLAIRTSLAVILTNADEFKRWWPSLGVEFFAVDEYYEAIVKFVNDFWRDHANPPSMELIVDHFMLTPSVSEDDREVILRALVDLMEAPVGDWPHHKTNLTEYVRIQAFTAAMTKAEELLGRGDYDGIVKAFTKAHSTGVDLDFGTTDFFSTVSVDDRFNRRTDPALAVPRIPTQIGNLDTHLKGGLKPKTLTVLVAGTGGGKSTGLVHLGRIAVLHGFKALHVTLELEKNDVIDKYDCAFTGVKLDELEKHAGKIRTEFLTKFAKYGDALRVCQFPEYSLSPEDLVTLLDVLSKSSHFTPDLVLVDYADLMTGGRRFHTSDRRFELNYIYTWLHRIAKDFNTRVVTATQANRIGMGKPIVELTDAAEDISKTWIADHVLTICQTQKERDSNRCRVFIAKSRSGRAFVEVAFQQDLSKSQFCVTSAPSVSRVVPADEVAPSTGVASATE